jgi:WD40 repeat protein/serine/threonine protein kinase
MPADSARAKSLFLNASDLAEPAERAAYLDRECGDDHALRARVEALLHAHEASVGATDARTLAFIPTTPYRPLTEGPGTKIGPYKLLQEIGEGGMGVVYMAEQEEPVRRKVALKIIKPGMDSQEVIARFEAERQALAMMDHQNIARVLDAGTTASGRPYFVMELVHGVPITKFSDDNKLTLRERLALFVPVCQAIQHAHQKGIIHRDVKPSNVLVTMYDDKPVPKVIDFGVAKAIEQRLTEKTMFTRFGALVGTLEYMSPEQAEMNAFGVDTRSDIYSLGVLLYELLTGTPPLAGRRLRTAAFDEMLRLIKEEEAPRPSMRLSSSQDLPKIAALRKTEPARLSKLVRGEIDWIVMKCLEKNRSRRYDTASALARDVERYLADETVEACPPSTRYRVTKFARKYKKGLATAAAFAGLLFAAVVLSAWLALRARLAEGEALKAKAEADRQRDEAKNAKTEADQQRDAAKNAKREAEEERDEARRTAYASGIGLALRAWDESNVVRARELLNQLPREAAGKDLRGFEWAYLSRLCHPDELTLEGHAGSVNSVAFSPDGQRLVSGSDDNTIKLWDSVTGKELLSLKGHTLGVWSVAFSPDGRRLASGSDDQTVRIWDSETGKELLTLKGHAYRVYSVAFSPDGRRLASASDDRTVKIWDIATGKTLFSLGNHGRSVLCVAFSSDGRLASGSTDSTVKIWDSAAGKELFALRGHADYVMSVVFSPDGRRLASASHDRTVKLWDMATRKVFTLKGHAGFVNCVAFSPDGQRLTSASEDRTIKIWDSATGQELLALKGHAGFVRSVAFSPDGQRLASASEDGTVKIWDHPTSKEVLSFKAHARAATSVAFSPDGRRLASASDEGTAKIWDSATGVQQLLLRGHRGFVMSVAFSPDGQRLASGSLDHTVKIWDVAGGKEIVSLKGHRGPVESVAFSPDGRRLASASWDDSVRIWDSASGKEVLSLKGHALRALSVVFSPDGRRLASAGGDLSMKLWDSETGKELILLKGVAGQSRGLAFSPDGRRLASANGQTVKIFDSTSGNELLSLKGHGNAVTSVAFSPDGRRLASGSYDQTVKIWDSATGRELGTLQAHAGTIRSVAFRPDGQCLAATGQDGSINLWETSISPEIRHRRATIGLVADLFRQMLCRTDVLERLRTIPGMSAAVRRDATEVAQAYPEDARALIIRARELAKRPGGEMPEYHKAVLYGEEACRLGPENGVLLNGLGMAYYRAGNYQKALETLRRSERMNKAQFEGSFPADLAFLAMAYQQLGQVKEAQAEFQRLRERMRDPRWAEDTDSQSFLREAEALLLKPKTVRN